jgi:jumonji domain-containing protein 7
LEGIGACLTDDSEGEVCYLQSQNGNMYSPTFFADEEGEDDCEFLPLRPDVPSQVSWCSEALGIPLHLNLHTWLNLIENSDKPPDAVNIWIGDSRSVTSIHSGSKPPTAW